jgi:vacuolar-type H+-ATPase subunit H
MHKIINEIINIEHLAQQITQSALLMKKNLKEDIKNEIAALKEKRFEDAKLLIEKSAKEKQSSTEAEVLKIRQTYSQKAKEIDKSFKENHDKWISFIYEKLIGR